MKEIIFSCVMMLSICAVVSAQDSLGKETEAHRKERMAWWTHARFGMFIHWGIYALPARHEWVKHYERMTNEEYQKYFERFDPDLYNPKEWARQAKQAGMKLSLIHI